MDFCEMKKVELHCHLDGSLPESTVRRLAANIGMELPDKETLLDQIRAGEDCGDLGEYLDRFRLPLALLRTGQNLKEAVEGVLMEAAKENVVYMELRFAPLSSVGDGLNVREAIASAVEGLKSGMEKSGVLGNLILCGMRHVPPEENCKILRIGREFLGEGVCGADMAGNEAAFPILGQCAFFEEAKKLGIPFTIHAGECGSPESVRDALDLGAARIGHGIAAWKDPAVMELCREKRIPLELCPVSNLQTKAAASPAEYPFRRFLEAGLVLTVNTDNRTVSGTTLTREFAWLEEHSGLTEEEARVLTRNAAEAAFAAEDMKQEILRRLGLQKGIIVVK